MHAPSLKVQVPSRLQRAEFRQWVLEVGAQAPFTTPHLPSFEHAAEAVQSSALATQRCSCREHWAASLQTLALRQSSTEVATQRPPSAAHRPRRAHALSGSGLSSLVPAQC